MKSQPDASLFHFFSGLLSRNPVAGPCRARAAGPRLIEANIRFDFTVGSQVFPAGQYGLKTIEPSQLELRNSAGRVLAHVLTHSVQTLSTPAIPKLVFDSAAVNTCSSKCGRRTIPSVSKFPRQRQPFVLSRSARGTSKLQRRAICDKHLTIAITRKVRA